MTRALLVPVSGPVEEHDLGDDSLAKLQELVGGYIEAVSIPEFVRDSGIATAYINEEGKYQYPLPEGMNWRATDFFVPGIGLFMGDHIAGPLVLVGFDPETGDNADIPAGVERRIRKIEREAG